MDERFLSHRSKAVPRRAILPGAGESGPATRVRSGSTRSVSSAGSSSAASRSHYSSESSSTITDDDRAEHSGSPLARWHGPGSIAYHDTRKSRTYLTRDFEDERVERVATGYSENAGYTPHSVELDSAYCYECEPDGPELSSTFGSQYAVHESGQFDSSSGLDVSGPYPNMQGGEPNMQGGEYCFAERGEPYALPGRDQATFAGQQFGGGYNATAYGAEQDHHEYWDEASQDAYAVPNEGVHSGRTVGAGFNEGGPALDDYYLTDGSHVEHAGWSGKGRVSQPASRGGERWQHVGLAARTHGSRPGDSFGLRRVDDQNAAWASSGGQYEVCCPEEPYFEHTNRNSSRSLRLQGGHARGQPAARSQSGRPTLQGPGMIPHQTQPAVADVFSLARHGRYDEVETLLDAGLNVDAHDRWGNTILTIACQNGLKRIAKLALRRGADINRVNFRGNTPLHYCYAYSYGDSLGAYLISKGADPLVRNQDGLLCHELARP